MTVVRSPVLVGVIALALVVITIAALVAAFVSRPPPASVASTALGAPALIEEATSAGLLHSYDGEFEYVVGGGVAAFDCNADWLPDLYIAGGSRHASLFVNRGLPQAPLRFEVLPDAVTDQVAVTGAYPIDIDSDGVTDLAVLRRGENLLLRGLGECRFERANERWGFDGGAAWSTAFSAKWDPGSAWPTIAVGNYLSSTEPTELACADNQLLTPDASGAPGFGEPVPLSPGWCTLSMLFSDWDRSGGRDLRVTNDRHYYADASDGQEQLWRIRPTEPARLYATDEGWQRLRLFGMGIASHDVTGDGLPDYYLTSQGDNKLQALADGPEQPRYADLALVRGATAHRPYEGDTIMPSTAWHAEFDDMNNDGLMDLFVAKGNVEAQTDHAARDPSNLLLGQPDGSFVEGAVDAGLLDYGRARGAAVVDLNRDGLLDLVVVDRRENVRLYRNAGSGSSEAGQPMGNWLEVRVSQEGANRDAIGSWLEVRAGGRTTLRELTIGGGHVSGQLGAHHFGLGSAQDAEVRMTWPDGEVGPWQAVGANQLVVVRRGATSVELIR
jgi:hypothetical protein